MGGSIEDMLSTGGLIDVSPKDVEAVRQLIYEKAAKNSGAETSLASHALYACSAHSRDENPSIILGGVDG